MSSKHLYFGVFLPFYIISNTPTVIIMTPCSLVKRSIFLCHRFLYLQGSKVVACRSEFRVGENEDSKMHNPENIKIIFCSNHNTTRTYLISIITFSWREAGRTSAGDKPQVMFRRVDSCM
jgi:hypothetical protein